MATGPAPQALSFDLLGLPDDLLLHVLAAVPLQDRLSKAALVCRRMSHLACAPLLLSNVSAELRSSEALRTFLPWLARRAACVHQLSLTVQPAVRPTYDVPTMQSWNDVFFNARQLRHLRISSYVLLPMLLPLALNVTSLHSLDIEFYFNTLPMAADASRLTALQRLRLAGEPLLVEATARLPASLTSLSLIRYGPLHSWQAALPVMPLQVATLPSLQRLQLTGFDCPAASMEALAHVSGLKHLSINSMRCILPAGLSALRTLRIHGTDAFELQLSAALPTLQQLTGLAVESRDPIPPAVAGLPQLRQLWWFTNGTQTGQLPELHSLSNLQLLGVNGRTAFASLPALTAMPALAELWLFNTPDAGAVPPDAWQAFWAFVVQHPPLRRLRLVASIHVSAATVQQHYALLQVARPGLTVDTEDFIPAYKLLPDWEQM